MLINGCQGQGGVVGKEGIDYKGAPGKILG